MNWYVYRQNNSGGSYHGPLGYVIQAESTDHADSIATTYTEIYFDGADCLGGDCEGGYNCGCSMDCPCCGDRWSRADDWDILGKSYVEDSYIWIDSDGSRTERAGDE